MRLIGVNQSQEKLKQTLSTDEAKRLIEERRVEIALYAVEEPRSSHARLYGMLADLTDEDGALTELDDLGDATDWLLGSE